MSSVFRGSSHNFNRGAYKLMEDDYQEFSPHFCGEVDAEDARYMGSTGQPAEEPQEEIL